MIGLHGVYKSINFTEIEKGALSKHVLIRRKTSFYRSCLGNTRGQELDERTAKNFVGGPALGAKILYDEMPAHTEALSPQSLIGFLAGPPTGPAPFWAAATPSCANPPLRTDGTIPTRRKLRPTLKSTGYDAIFVKGRSKKPVYIFVDNGRVEFHDASKIMGTDVRGNGGRHPGRLGDRRIGIALIGPAGEQLSNMAAIMNDSHRAGGKGRPGRRHGV